MYKLIIDDREQKIIPYLKNINDDEIEIKIDRINIGDYCIIWKDYILFAIERKTWKDLSASIKDGRKENVNKLISIRTKYPLCKVFYLIEGKSRYSPNKKFNRIPYKNLQSHLDHLMMRDNIFIIYSSDIEDTSKRLIELIKNFITLQSPILNEISLLTGGEEIQEKKSEELLKTKIIKSDIEIIYNIWCCIPGITTKTANLFIEKDIHISDLLLNKINEDYIYLMKYPSGSIIGKRTKKIIKIQNLKDENNNKYYVLMLSCIKGITKKTATLLLENFFIKDLLENKIDKNNIINLKKTEKNIIGKKVTDDIFKFFIKERISI
jgi:ERCC4-type nuclease